MDTIKSSQDISYLFSFGKRFHTPYLTFIVSRQTYKEPAARQTKGRVAFIAGKRLGNAVWRNKAKRRMRGLCRDLGGPWENLDVIFLAKPAVVDAEYSKVLKASEKTCNLFSSHFK